MARVVITLEDQPTGEMSVHTDFTPAVGTPCSVAQAAALDIIALTKKMYGITQPTANNGTQGQPT